MLILLVLKFHPTDTCPITLPLNVVASRLRFYKSSYNLRKFGFSQKKNEANDPFFESRCYSNRNYIKTTANITVTTKTLVYYFFWEYLDALIV